MIKKEQFEESIRNSRVDSLAKALGLSWENGEYKKVMAVKNIVRTPAVASTHRRRYGRLWEEPLYQQIERLGVGESMDISAPVRLSGTTRSQTANRIYMHMYKRGMNKTHRYSVKQFRGVATVTRL